MVDMLVIEMNKVLNADCYLAALAIALMLPDICGKAEYPTENSVAKRYIGWFDEYIGKYEKPPKADDMPYLSGEVIYNLRNSFLHQGTPNIDINKIKQEQNKIDIFELIIEKKNKFDIYTDSGVLLNKKLRIYRVNIRRLCLIIGNTAIHYYENNKEKFNFFQYSIIDWDKEVDKMRKLGF